jgi:hypothetical protein
MIALRKIIRILFHTPVGGGEETIARFQQGILMYTYQIVALLLRKLNLSL